MNEQLNIAAEHYSKGENFKIDEFTGFGISKNSFIAGANWVNRNIENVINSHAELLKALTMANDLLKATYGTKMFAEWVESPIIELAIKNAKEVIIT